MTTVFRLKTFDVPNCISQRSLSSSLLLLLTACTAPGPQIDPGYQAMINQYSQGNPGNLANPLSSYPEQNQTPAFNDQPPQLINNQPAKQTTIKAESIPEKLQTTSPIDGFQFKVYQAPNQLYYWKALGGACQEVGLFGMGGRLDDILNFYDKTPPETWPLTIYGQSADNTEIKYSLPPTAPINADPGYLAANSGYQNFDPQSCLQNNHHLYAAAFLHWVETNQTKLKTLYLESWGPCDRACAKLHPNAANVLQMPVSSKTKSSKAKP